MKLPGQPLQSSDLVHVGFRKLVLKRGIPDNSGGCDELTTVLGDRILAQGGCLSDSYLRGDNPSLVPRQVKIRHFGPPIP